MELFSRPPAASKGPNDHDGRAIDRVDSGFVRGGPGGGVLRDHKIMSESDRQYLATAAESAAQYRSAEQAFTDNRQATGFATRGPVSFGKYEVGRSSMPGITEDDGKAVFADSMKRGLIHPHMDGQAVVQTGDPGAYDPYVFSEIRHTASFTMNRSKAPFGTLQARDLKLQLTGEGVPGPGTYNMAIAAKKIFGFVDDNRSVFLSETPQREVHSTAVPGPDAYTPNMQSVYPNIRDSGASMRGTLVRLATTMKHPSHVGGDPSMTDEAIGPGAYEDHLHNTVATTLEKAASRSSRLQPGFGTMTPQRALPYGQKDESPGPGAYQPLVWGGRYDKKNSRIRPSPHTPIRRKAGAVARTEPTPASNQESAEEPAQAPDISDKEL